MMGAEQLGWKVRVRTRKKDCVFLEKSPHLAVPFDAVDLQENLRKTPGCQHRVMLLGFFDWERISDNMHFAILDLPLGGLLPMSDTTWKMSKVLTYF